MKEENIKRIIQNELDRREKTAIEEGLINLSYAELTDEELAKLYCDVMTEMDKRRTRTNNVGEK